MPKALDLHFAPRAEKDIDRIYNYTEAEWGTEQAEKYVGEIRVACEQLVEVPGIGRSVDHVRRGYFIITCGSHTIFFRQEKTRIVIVRILHQRMDFKRHLSPSAHQPDKHHKGLQLPPIRLKDRDYRLNTGTILWRSPKT